MFQFLGRGADEPGEFLRVGLDDVGCGRAESRGQGVERALGGVDGDLAGPRRQLCDDVGVPRVGHTGWQRSGQHDPRRVLGVRQDRSGQCLERNGVEVCARLVELGRGAVGLGDRQVGPHDSADRDALEGDAGRAEGGDHRVVVGGGQDGDRVEAGQHQCAGDVDALAAGLADGGGDAMHGAAGQRRAQCERAVDAGVGGDGDDHSGPPTTMTSTPSSPSRRRSASEISASVMRVSTLESGAKLMKSSRPTFVESAATTT